MDRKTFLGKLAVTLAAVPLAGTLLEGKKTLIEQKEQKGATCPKEATVIDNSSHAGASYMFEMDYYDGYIPPDPKGWYPLLPRRTK